MGIMATDRVVIAIDTPGYGDSARAADTMPSIADYAKSASIALTELGCSQNGQKIDLLGYHTGSLIAAELAIMQAKSGPSPRSCQEFLIYIGKDREAAYQRNVKPDARFGRWIPPESRSGTLPALPCRQDYPSPVHKSISMT